MLAIANGVASHRCRYPAFSLFARAPPVLPTQPFPNAHAAAFLLNGSTAVTALHAVSRNSPPSVAGHPTTLLRSCVHADLAVLSLSPTVSHRNPVTTTLANPSSDRYTVHSPYAPPTEVTLLGLDTALIVYSGAFVPVLALKCDRPIPRGWSGSPILDHSNNVVGVLIQSRGREFHAIPSRILAYLYNHRSPAPEIGYITTAEFRAKLNHDDDLHSINGHAVSANECEHWGIPAPLQAAVFDVPHEKVEAEIVRAGEHHVVKLDVGTASEASALRGRRGVCVEAGAYVMEAVSVELLETRYGARWARAELVDEVLHEGDDVVVFVRDAGEDVLFERLSLLNGKRVTQLSDVVCGGNVKVGNRWVNVPEGKVRICFVSEW